MQQYNYFEKLLIYHCSGVIFCIIFSTISGFFLFWGAFYDDNCLSGRGIFHYKSDMLMSFCFQDTNKVTPTAFKKKSNHCRWLDKKLMMLSFQLKRHFCITIEQNVIQPFQYKRSEWMVAYHFSKAWFFQLVGLSKSLYFCFRYADTTCSKSIVKIIIEYYIYGSHRHPTTTFWHVRQP